MPNVFCASKKVKRFILLHGIRGNQWAVPCSNGAVREMSMLHVNCVSRVQMLRIYLCWQNFVREALALKCCILPSDLFGNVVTRA